MFLVHFAALMSLPIHPWTVLFLWILWYQSLLFSSYHLVTSSQFTSQLFILSSSLNCKCSPRFIFSFFLLTLLYAPWVIFIYFHGFICHLYGESAQIYISGSNHSSECQTCLSSYLLKYSTWISKDTLNVYLYKYTIIYLFYCWWTFGLFSVFCYFFLLHENLFLFLHFLFQWIVPHLPSCPSQQLRNFCLLLYFTNSHHQPTLFTQSQILTIIILNNSFLFGLSVYLKFVSLLF